MKAGTRALGVAESYTTTSDTADDPTGSRSILAGAVVRADRVLDGLAFDACTVGGTDVTRAIESLARSVGRPDVRFFFVAGIAPAWFNIVDVDRLAQALDRPVLSVSFEASPGLEDALRAQFDGDALAERLKRYRAQPQRQPVEVNNDRVFVRAAGCDAGTAARVVRQFTPTGGRPEPLRVARLAARAGRRWREE